jgi:cytochrome c oxidase subunit III
MAELVTAAPSPLPVGPVRDQGIGRGGMFALIASEAALFGYLLFSYYYTGASAPPPWVLEAHPSLTLALPDTLILLLSSVAIWFAERATRHEERAKALIGSGAALVLGTIFVLVQLLEWKRKSFGVGRSSYASLYYITTGFHLAHVLVGLAVLAMLFVWTCLGYFTPTRRIVFTNGSYYWHFVDAVWLLVFATYYVTPYLGFGT